MSDSCCSEQAQQLSSELLELIHNVKKIYSHPLVHRSKLDVLRSQLITAYRSVVAASPSQHDHSSNASSLADFVQNVSSYLSSCQNMISLYDSSEYVNTDDSVFTHPIIYTVSASMSFAEMSEPHQQVYFPDDSFSHSENIDSENMV